jgi:hypothetical protein
MSEELINAMREVLGEEDSGRAMKLLARLIDAKLEQYEENQKEILKKIDGVNERISKLKSDMDTFHFFSRKPKIALAVLIAVIILCTSGVQNIFSFFAKLL